MGRDDRGVCDGLKGVACLLPRAAHTAGSGFHIWRGTWAPKRQAEMCRGPASLDFHSSFQQSHSFSSVCRTPTMCQALASGARAVSRPAEPSGITDRATRRQQLHTEWWVLRWG